MIWSIRTKFLTVFILGVMFTLITALFISYSSMDVVYNKLNESIVRGELNQISGEIGMLLSETETLISTRVLNNRHVNQIVRGQEENDREFIIAVRGLAEEVVDITGNFPYIDSVNIYVLDEWFLAMANKSTRMVRDFRVDGPEERIVQMLRTADPGNGWGIKGDIDGEDLVGRKEQGIYLAMYTNLYTAYGKSSCIINIKEKALYEKYTGFLNNEKRMICVVDRNGIIVSAADKSSIGTKLVVWENLKNTGDNVIRHEDAVISCQPVKGYNLTVVSSIPISVYMEGMNVVRNRLLFVFGAGMILLSAVIGWWISWKLAPIKELGNSMKKAGTGDYSGKLQVSGKDELAELTWNYNSMLVELETYDENRRVTEEELRRRELIMLRNEINPHFLYNTLSTIKCMAFLEDKPDIVQCISSLGAIVEPLYKVTAPTWSLGEELRLVKEYLKIMNIRYEDGIHMECSISDEILDVPVMRFILQPVIENSILHGFDSRGYSGQIYLSAVMEPQVLEIVLEDDGKGMSEVMLDEMNDALRKCGDIGGIGMLNVNRRIILRYGEDYGIRLALSVYGGLKTVIRMPVKGSVLRL